MGQINMYKMYMSHTTTNFEYTLFDLHTRNGVTSTNINPVMYIDFIIIYTVHMDVDVNNIRWYTIYSFKNMCDELYKCDEVFVDRIHPVYNWVSEITYVLKSYLHNTMYLSNTQFKILKIVPEDI